MKQILKSALVCTSLVAALTACTKDEDNKKDNSGEIKRIQATKSMEANDLADAGEQLVSPYTWMLADRVFTMALEKDPLNNKAQFYKHLLKPMMVYRGIAKRIKPFARQYGNIGNLEESIQKFPKSPLKDFLLDGNEDISTAKQIQDLVVAQREAFNEFRKYLKENSDAEFTMNLNPYVWQQAIDEKRRDSCKVIENSPSDVVVDCNFEDTAITKIGTADNVAAAQMVAGYVLFFDLYTSYSVEGLETIYKQLQNPNLTGQQRQRILESVPTIGKLRPDHALNQVLEMGSDFAAAAKWALKYQDRLCALGAGQENRPGFAINKGLCIENPDEVTRSLALLEQGLKGAISLTVKDRYDQEVQTTLNYFKFFTQPVNDLRSVAPTAYCKYSETPSALRDHTLGGLYPNGDAERFTLSPCWE